ncbi:hypothetical protein CG473_04120 [Mycoplasma testudineum]|nr:hypothetical protein CG473_04120 [Mycoplasma testudineum]
MSKKHKIKFLLKAANISKSTYFYNLKCLELSDKDKEIHQKILEIAKLNNFSYGYRRIKLELQNQNIVVNHKKILKIMRHLSLSPLKKAKKFKTYKGEIGKWKPNLLIEKQIVNNKEIYIQNFKANRINEKWATDVTEFSIASGKLYLSPIIDLFSREIVSYSISKSPNFKQITDMLKIAFDKFDNLDGLIFHSDQGWQYQMRYYQNELKKNGIIQSMSRKGNCLDNSIIENFFSILKTEMFYKNQKYFNSLEELELAIIEYIDYYNNRRIKAKLKGMSPYNFRQHSLEYI